MNGDAAFDYIKNHGQKGQIRLEYLAKLHHFLEAWKSEIGKQILSVDVERLKLLLEKHIVELDKMPLEELIELRLIKKRIEHISACLVNYEKGTQEILTGGQKERD